MLDRTKGIERLQQVVQDNLARNSADINTVLEQVPVDAIVRANALTWEVKEDGRVEMVTPAQQWGVHRHALGHALGVADIPMTYAERLKTGESWQRQLLGHALNETFRHLESRHLVRALPLGERLEARALLSDRYRRLDTRPLLDAFLGVANASGLLPYNATVADTRVAVKMISPEVHEINGDIVALGAEYRNSDYGAGTAQLTAFLLRLICLNGATLAKEFRQVHLGKRLDESIEYSQRTYQLDTDATSSAIRDISAKLLGDGRRNELLEQLRAAQQQEMSADALGRRIERTATKEEKRKIVEAFESPDVINLPPGNSAWRASNAISWVANMAGPDRKLDLERLAGEVIA